MSGHTTLDQGVLRGPKTLNSVLCNYYAIKLLSSKLHFGAPRTMEEQIGLGWFTKGSSNLFRISFKSMGGEGQECSYLLLWLGYPGRVRQCAVTPAFPRNAAGASICCFLGNQWQQEPVIYRGGRNTASIYDAWLPLSIAPGTREKVWAFVRTPEQWKFSPNLGSDQAIGSLHSRGTPIWVISI